MILGLVRLAPLLLSVFSKRMVLGLSIYVAIIAVFATNLQNLLLACYYLLMKKSSKTTKLLAAGASIIVLLITVAILTAGTSNTKSPKLQVVAAENFGAA